MINLLPPQEKEELMLQKYRRLVMVLGNMMVVILLCLTLILFALRFYILAEVEMQKLNLTLSQKKYDADGTTTLKKTINRYNAFLTKFDNFYSKNIFLNEVLINALSIERPNGLFFKEVSIDHPKDGATGSMIKITIVGFADTRENLLQFKKNVEENGKVKNVIFPPQNWVREKDIDFEVTFENK